MRVRGCYGFPDQRCNRNIQKHPPENSWKFRVSGVRRNVKLAMVAGMFAVLGVFMHLLLPSLPSDTHSW